MNYIHWMTGFRQSLVLFLFLCPFSFLCAAPPEAADESSGDSRLFHFFPEAPLLPAFTSESRSTVNRFEFQSAGEAPPQYPWSTGFGRRVILDIQLGLELPILGGEAGSWSWYFGLPIAFELLNDFFEPTTAPVMNTDYWFGTRLEVLYSFGENLRWPKNISLRTIPFFHESTHIGDEFSFRIAVDTPDDYYRINLSYEAWEVTVGIDEWANKNRNAYNLRFGMSGKWNKDGYYSPSDPSELGTGPEAAGLVPSRRGMEYFGQFNLVVADGFPAAGRWVFQWGLEARNRILLDYFSTDPEQRVWTAFSTLGWYLYPDGAFGRRVGFYLRFLGGQNPHGQFREQDGYFVFGTGFSLGI